MIGKEILNYTIVSFIGKGGMGSVYLAEHKYIKQQKVAIKVINSEMVNDFTRKHLEEEAEHLASLNHQNIVHFQDYHIDEEGNIYLIMEYADGVNLDEYIRTISGLIVEDRICALFEPILDAVGYAHKHKIVHLDIKPANIIITHEGIPKILDFGIAKIMDNKGDHDSASSEGLIMGTPSYMSPEQVKGEELDGRSDIYSLGVLLHQMMTGNAPYDTTTLTEYDINKKVVEEPLPRMRTYYKYVSDKVQAVVDKATAKRKEDRYQTCEEFKKALHAAIYPPKIPRWAKLGAVAAILLIVCGGVYWWDYTRVKVFYYKDYVEQWGVPQGIHKLSGKEQAHRTNSYKFEYCRRQLQRMSYVNSKRHLITHNSTDDIDRPTDMKLFYQANGDLDYVKVLDQSGKVLYVKDYSPDLKVAIFKYDDEYGTEKNLTANSVTTFTSTMDDSNSKSKISRYLITYDENGYATQLRYATYQNVLVCDNEGIYGKTFKRDEKGRVTEETFIGNDGNPKAIKSGMAIRTREYNSEDDAVRFTYLSADREPSGEADLGVPVCHNIVDEWGNTIRQQYEDMEGNLVLRLDANIAAYEYEIEDGLAVKLIALDVDGKRCYEKTTRTSGSLNEYDENGYPSGVRYLDVDDKPMACNDGSFGFNSKNDASGNAVWLANVDSAGNNMNTSNGFSIVRATYDDRGNMLELSWYDKNDSLTDQNNGVAIQRYEYDEQNRMVALYNYDKQRKPTQNNMAVHCMENVYSKQGNLTQVAYYDAEGKNLALNIEGIAGWISEFDDWGNEVKRLFFDTDRKATALADGYAGWCASYDERGNQLDIYYFDKDEKICMTKMGYAGTKCEFDERGNMLSSMDYGTDRKLASGRLLARYKYDEKDNQTEFAVFDKSGKPALNANNYHKKVSSYNARRQPVEEKYYGTDGKPITVENANYAMVKYVYDAKGDNVETSFFGVDGAPVCKSKDEQYATHKSEFDNMGRVVHQRFYDEKGKPTVPSKMVPEGFCKYDKWGNMCYLASADGNGNLILNPVTGWCICRYEYNSRGNLLSESYYDKDDKPMAGNNGYHKVVAKYNAAGNITELAYLDTAGKPVPPSVYYAKVVYDYDEDGNYKTRKYYDNQGKLRLTEYWNGLQWTSGQSSAPAASSAASGGSNWQSQIKSLASELPLDLGDEANHLVVTSAKVIGKNACEMTFKAPKSKYEMAAEELQGYIASVKLLAGSFHSEGILPSGVSLRVILYDSKGRILYNN